MGEEFAGTRKFETKHDVRNKTNGTCEKFGGTAEILKFDKKRDIRKKLDI